MCVLTSLIRRTSGISIRLDLCDVSEAAFRIEGIDEWVERTTILHFVAMSTASQGFFLSCCDDVTTLEFHRLSFNS